jgi:hypothetical protein
MSTLGRMTTTSGRTPAVPGRPDITSLVAGTCVAALGLLLLLDAVGTFDLRFGVFAPAACAALGAILLASGMTRPR